MFAPIRQHLRFCLTLALLAAPFRLPAQTPFRQNPVDAAIQAAWQSQPNSQEQAARQDQARALFAGASPAEPQFGAWAQMLSQFYQNRGHNREARAILEDAIARAGAGGASNQTQAMLLTSLSDSWRQDGNLVKAAMYMESALQTATRPEPPVTAAQAPGGATQAIVNIDFSRAPRVGYRYSQEADYYSRLAQIYRMMGKKEKIAALAGKVRAFIPGYPSQIAAFYEQNGQLDAAAAIYREQVANTTEPWTALQARQALARILDLEEKPAEALAEYQQGIAEARASAEPAIANNAVWMSAQIGQAAIKAGVPQQAEQTFQELLRDQRFTQIKLQIVSNYSNFLLEMKRYGQAHDLLQDSLDNGSLDPEQRANILHNLSYVAQTMGDPKAGDQYAAAARALQRVPDPDWNPAGPYFREAQTALNKNQIDEAYGLALDGIAHSRPADLQSMVWQVPTIAIGMVNHKQPAKGEELYRRLFAQLESNAANLQSRIQAAQSYVPFLRMQPERRDQESAAIDEYERLLLEANGPDSGTLTEVLRMKLDAARARQQWQQGEAIARTWLEMEEGLSGVTSERYISVLQEAANIFRLGGQLPEVIALCRKSIGAADALATPNTPWRRSQARMDTANALAAAHQFEEALALADESVKICEGKTSEANFVNQRNNILRMKKAWEAGQPNQ